MSLLTDFLKLFKWDTTSETDLDEEFDIDTSMNGNWDILDTKAKEHDDKINTLEEVQAEQDSLIQKLKESMINISTEEATSLHVTDVAELPAKLSVRGNHKQETREGYNIFDYLSHVTASINGLITTTDKVGYITVNGTPTQDWDNILVPIYI